MAPDIAGAGARQFAQRPAAWWDGCWHDYAELDARASQLARRLAAAGVRRGDRVAILAHNHPVHLDSILAAGKLGCVHVPFNHRLPPAAQRALAAAIAPALLLCDARCADGAAAFDCPRIDLAGYDAWRSEPAPPLSAPPPSGEDTHMILFTGGSTGVPKGAMLPFRQTLANAADTVAAWGLTAEDCAIQATPAFHAAVNVLATPLLACGGRVVWLDAFEPGAYLRAVAQHRATVLFLVPTMYQMLAEHPDFVHADLSSVRWAITGGAPCPPALRERFAARGIAFRLGYGMTEVGVNCFHIGSDEARAHPDSVGRPMPSLQAQLRRADGSECADGETGELHWHGPQVCAGYWAAPAETAQALRDGWFASGDLAVRDAAGRYTIRGRRKEMYISGGENVYPAEVEAALSRLPGVAECAVLGIPHPRWGETGLAAVVLRAGAPADAAALRTALRAELAGYKLPGEFLFLGSLPRTGPGKVDKPEIRALHERLQGARGDAGGTA